MDQTENKSLWPSWILKLVSAATIGCAVAGAIKVVANTEEKGKSSDDSNTGMCKISWTFFPSTTPPKKVEQQVTSTLSAMDKETVTNPKDNEARGMAPINQELKDSGVIKLSPEEEIARLLKRQRDAILEKDEKAVLFYAEMMASVHSEKRQRTCTENEPVAATNLPREVATLFQDHDGAAKGQVSPAAEACLGTQVCTFLSNFCSLTMP